MDDELFNLYSEELRYMACLFEEFCEAHPEAATALKITPTGVEDPHVTRFIQSFALVGADIKKTLNDGLSDFTRGLLEQLFPHFLRPFPSCTLIQLAPENDLTESILLPAPHGIEMHAGGQSVPPCYFNTVYDVVLRPIALHQVQLSSDFHALAKGGGPQQGKSFLTLQFHALDSNLRLGALSWESVRFAITAPAVSAYKLYDLLFFNTVEIWVKSGEEPYFPLPDRSLLRPVGFEKSESMLHYSDQSSHGYSLLTEYFAFPEKFLFFDVQFPLALSKTWASATLEVVFIFNKQEKQLEPYLNHHAISLHCTPAVNLFKKTAEPILIDFTQPDYLIQPELESGHPIDVYQVKEVALIDENQRVHPCYPFYSAPHTHRRREMTYLWQLHWRSGAGKAPVPQAYIGITPRDVEPDTPVDRVLHVELLCTNGSTPARWSAAHFPLHLQCVDASVPLEGMKLVTPLTASLSPPSSESDYASVLAHLNLNYARLSRAPLEALQKTVTLYDWVDNDKTHQLMEAIQSLEQEKIVRRDPSGTLNTFIQGVKIKLTVSTRLLANHSLYLLGSILDYFFSLQCAWNSFTVLELYDQHNRRVHTWPARNGMQPIV